MEMYCRYCHSVCETEEVHDDETGFSFFKCQRCGSDNVSEYETCNICEEPVPREDATWFSEDGNYYCQDCINRYADQAINSLSWQERVALNIRYEGEYL